MKRIIAISLVIFTLFLPLTSCERGERGAFFADELLAEYGMTDLPSPELENARLFENALYFTMDEDAFANYARNILNYMISNDKIPYFGTSIDSFLVAEMFPGNTIAPIGDANANKIDFTRGYTFYFTNDPELDFSSSVHGYSMEDGAMLSLERNAGGEMEKVPLSNFKYNCKMVIKDVSRLLIWGYEREDSFAPEKEIKQIQIISDFAISRHSGTHRFEGETVNIKVLSGDKVAVAHINGEPLEANAVNGKYTEYVFTMPSEHVQIEIKAK